MGRPTMQDMNHNGRCNVGGCNGTLHCRHPSDAACARTAPTGFSKKRCDAWSYPGHDSWDQKLTKPDGRQCAHDAGHPGPHELSGPWTAISRNGANYCKQPGCVYFTAQPNVRHYHDATGGGVYVCSQDVEGCTRTDFHIHTSGLDEKLDKLANSHKEHVNHPSHYGGDTTYETVKVLAAWGLGFLLGNTVKYISRAGKKDPGKLVEDLKKAKWYLDKAIEHLERGEPLF